MNPHRIAIIAAVIAFIQTLLVVGLGVVGITILASKRSELRRRCNSV